ncbi:MAG: hypothetical protein N2485_00050 [bacterium]|nr:hypothetical protein [bacterium]
MYKDNPLIQYIAEVILKDEKKIHQEKLERQKEEKKNIKNN